MNILTRMAGEVICPTVERTVNTPELKAELGIPSGISFKVTVPNDKELDGLPWGLKVTAVGDGFTAAELYTAEWRLEQRFIQDVPEARTVHVLDH